MDQNVLAIVPARSGSRGLPKKNILPLAGFPLLAHSVYCARMTDSVDNVMVSTDSNMFARVARQHGALVPQLRPPRLAESDTGMWETLQHAVQQTEEALGTTYTHVISLQPTNPARLPRDIEEGLEKLTGDVEAKGVMGVSHPDFHIGWQSMNKNSEGHLEHLFEDSAQAIRRQDVERYFYINGLLYIFERDFLLENSCRYDGPLVGLKIPNGRSIDIDCRQEYQEARLKIESGFIELPWVANLDTSQTPDESIRPVVDIDDTIVGDHLPCFLIAEAGVNHNGSPQRARKLIDKAADAGVDAVKFQTFIPTELASQQAEKATYQKDATDSGKSQLDMLQDLALEPDVFENLKDYAEQRGLIFLSTPFEETSARHLEKLDISAYKIGSGELTNLPLLRMIAQFGRPMLLSTGMANMSEVNEAVEAIRGNGDPPLAMFHCVSNYPTSPVDANLQAIRTLKESFNIPVGWSDHTLGTEVSAAAVNLGASMIEKHFTLDRNLPGPDHASSLEPDELEKLVNHIRLIERSEGHGGKIPMKGEKETASIARKSICAARDLEAGTKLTQENIRILRPGTGLPPSQLDEVYDAILRNKVMKDTPIRQEDLQIQNKVR